MKKLCILLLAVCLCMPVCFPAFADMGGPEFVGYTAKTRADVPYYTWEYDEAAKQSYLVKVGTLPAGTVLNISNEYSVERELYAVYDKKDDNTGDYITYYVRARDLTTGDQTDSVRVTAYKQSASVRLRVTDPAGLTLYAGPSGSYPELGVIPQGTELTVDTLNQEAFESGAWMYVQTGSLRGWTHCFLYDGRECPVVELLPKGEEGTVWVVKPNAVLQDREGNALVTVPRGEKLTFDAFNRQPYTTYCCVTYAGKTGFFVVDEDGYNNVVATNTEGYKDYAPLVSRSFTAGVYQYPDDILPIGTVRYQAGETLESDFLYYAEPENGYRGGIEWNYVEKDGQSGWIKVDGNNLEHPEDFSGYTDKLPRLPMGSSAQKITVTVEQTTAPKTTAARSDGTTSAARSGGEQMIETEPAAVSERTETVSQTDVPQTSDTAPAETASEAVAVSGRPLSSARIIGVCIGAAVILALTALVTLRLIRRKKAD